MLRATGTPAEAGLAFAGLHQLLRSRPVPAPLARALGLERRPGAGPAPSRRRAAGGAGRRRARRRAGRRRASGSTRRRSPRSPSPRGGSRARAWRSSRRSATTGRALDLPELVLAPLDDAAAAALLDEQAPHPAARATVLAAAAGNPLALVELPAALGGAVPAGALPVPERLEAVYRARIAALPPPARGAAAARRGRGHRRPRAGARRRQRAIGALEASGLVAVAGDRLAWRHPLAREAVLGAAGAGPVRDAHRGLAAVSPADRVAWHRAAAATGARRGGRGRAGRGRARGAGPRRPRGGGGRAGAGGRAHARAGGRRRAAGRGGRGGAGRPGGPSGRSRCSTRRGRTPTAASAPASAARSSSTTAPRRARTGCWPRPRGASPTRRGRCGWASARWRRRRSPASRRYRPYAADGDGFLATFVAGITARVEGDEPAAAAALGAAVAAGRDARGPAARAVGGRGRVLRRGRGRRHALHERAADLARAAADASVLPFALTFLATAHLLGGRLALAEADGREARRLAAESGQENLGVQVDAVLAGVAAVRGDEAACRDAARRGPAPRRGRAASCSPRGRRRWRWRSSSWRSGTPDAAV